MFQNRSPSAPCFTKTTLFYHYPPLPPNIDNNQSVGGSAEPQQMSVRVEILSLGDISSWHVTLTLPFESWDGWSALSPLPQTGDIVCRDRIQREGRVYSSFFLSCSPHDSAKLTHALDGVGEKQDLERNFSSFFSSLFLSLVQSAASLPTATFCFKLNLNSFLSSPNSQLSWWQKRKVKLSPSLILKCRMWWRKCLPLKIIHKKTDLFSIITLNDIGLRTFLGMRQFWRKRSRIDLRSLKVPEQRLDQ